MILLVRLSFLGVGLVYVMVDVYNRDKVSIGPQPLRKSKINERHELAIEGSNGAQIIKSNYM